MISDLPEEVVAALRSNPDWDLDTIVAAPLLGGLSNSNWLVTDGGRKSVMKIPGAGSEEFLDRRVANEAANRGFELGISPEVLHFDPVSGVEVTDYLGEYRPSIDADFSRTDFRESVIDLYVAYNSGEPVSYTKNVFEMVDAHLSQIEDLDAIVPANFEWLIGEYQRAKGAFLASGLDLVPCHNDPIPGNFLVTEEADRITNMKMIDFEWSSNNERAYELAVFLGEVFVPEDESLALIERFYGRVDKATVARVMVARAVADIKWGSWGVVQHRLSSWDFDYQKLGIWKYLRARVLFDDPRWDSWLAAI